MFDERVLPLLAKRLRRGGRAPRKCNVTFESADGVVVQASHTLKDHPVRASSVTLLFLSGAATPP